MIPNRDIEHHNINIETSPAVRKIIQVWRKISKSCRDLDLDGIMPNVELF